MTVIEARGLGHRFGPARVVGPLDLEVEPRERLAVLGGNGSGKTTLLRILATALKPASGRLWLFGLDARSNRTEARSRLGFLGHSPALYPALTALENLRFFCTLQDVETGRAEECLSAVGLEAHRNRLAGALSRGEQQRLALARSLLHDPELWILDEPDTSLDATGLALLGDFAEGRTVVLSTHDKRLGRELCDRVLRLPAGDKLEQPQALDAAG